MNKKVYLIETKKKIPEIMKPLRVAAYARVSTGEERQLASLEAQEDYYRQRISREPRWIFAGIYVDRGISGLSYQKREQFKKMIADCEAGKIDIILTKSISRFARNTVDTIKVVRRLKELGIGVKFEKENLWSLDSKGEFILTLMASFAQEESRSISENTTWGIRKKMADGEYWVAYGGFLGYGRDFVIEDEGAYTVKLIYKRFIQGGTAGMIARLLTDNYFKTPRGGSTWSPSVVRSILQNEKYKGDALTQKYYIQSYLKRKAVKNKGEIEKHYITAGHEPIIQPELFDYVQEILAERICGHPTSRYSGEHYTSSKFFCSRCGGRFGRKPIHSNDKYRHVILQCQNRFRKDAPCRNRHFRDNELPALFTEIFKAVMRKYSSAEKMCLRAVSDIVDEKRLKEICRYIKHTEDNNMQTSEEEWAMLVKSITVYDRQMKVELFGGVLLNIRK